MLYRLLKKITTIIFSIRHRKNLIMRGGKMHCDGGCCFLLDPTARIHLNKNITLQANSIKRNGRSSILRMDQKSEMFVNGHFSFYYGADVILFENSKLVLGNSFINSDCKIRCHKHIEIGDGCAISHDCTIMDSKAHKLDGSCKTEPVMIGNRVWIGTRVLILPGVKIGDGSVIAAGAVVSSSIPEKCLAAGIPARVIRENVEWE